MKTQAELVCHFPSPNYIKQHLGSDCLCMFAVLFKNLKIFCANFWIFITFFYIPMVQIYQNPKFL